jgi:phosphatidylserine/phosphatidylglycerophosphate/cardiolipin synthase-like enzyme
MSAKRRGVDVQVVVDERGNHSKASIAALNLVAGASIPVRTVSVYPIHHDKYAVVDGKTVQNGSFNYSAAAARRNSENALVISSCTALAQQYLGHWQSRWSQGADWRMTY